MRSEKLDGTSCRGLLWGGSRGCAVIQCLRLFWSRRSDGSGAEAAAGKEQRGTRPGDNEKDAFRRSPKGLIGTLAVGSLAKPAIRPAPVGSGRRPPQGAVSPLPHTLWLKRHNSGCVRLCKQNRQRFFSMIRDSRTLFVTRCARCAVK